MYMANSDKVSLLSSIFWEISSIISQCQFRFSRGDLDKIFQKLQYWLNISWNPTELKLDNLQNMGQSTTQMFFLMVSFLGNLTLGKGQTKGNKSITAEVHFEGPHIWGIRAAISYMNDYYLWKAISLGHCLKVDIRYIEFTKQMWKNFYGV